ncbi:MASE1 domain-containing protein [Rahnella sp. ChDrAdgB13]|uniref:MASE1 domain-containing protein n=1 Tax=Rahnella sp. ChDrAdgB13 TaxID=1850581 RepID=UPI001AD88B04|nr:MASE1 domain-containing protein [Rahnella sp. ChDrAdgB13]
MKESASERYRLFLYILPWSLLYFTLGYCSLLLDDPISRVALVWFPAGVAVSAFLLAPGKKWYLIYLALFLTRTLLDALMRHSPGTSLVLSVVSLSCDFMITWCVRRFAGHADDLRKVVVWLVSVGIFSAIAAVAGTRWLASQYAFSFIRTAGIWWAANVVGCIVITTVLTGLVRASDPPVNRRWFAAVVAAALTVFSTVLIFTLPPAREDQVGGVYALACIPVLITVLVPVISSDRAGALVYALFCTLVIYFSWQQTGPFFIKGLLYGEPLLIAQCYLAGTAILMIFIRIQMRTIFNANAARPDDDGEVAYYLDIRTGIIHWDPTVVSNLGKVTAAVHSRESLFALVGAPTQAKIESRWQAVLAGKQIEKEYRFRLSLPGFGEVVIAERNMFCMPGQHDNILVGYWTEAGNVLTPHAKQEF